MRVPACFYVRTRRTDLCTDVYVCTHACLPIVCFHVALNNHGATRQTFVVTFHTYLPPTYFTFFFTFPLTIYVYLGLAADV